MNCVIALCHFCDTHGPRNVLCTQAINRDEDKMLREAVFTTVDKEADQMEELNLPLSQGYKASRCKSCQSLGDDSCLVSYDDQTEIYYISSESPRNTSVYHLVRTACLRSLYNEQTQGRGGSILFGHDNYMIGCSTFYLKDIQARGQTRLYSIQLILHDKFMSTTSWSYVIDQFDRIADQLTECTELVFEEEAATLLSLSVRPYSYAVVSNSASRRSIADITALPDIATRLHSWFTWILRSLPQLTTENVFEGQLTEDQAYTLEALEEQVGESDETLMSVSPNYRTNQSSKYSVDQSVSDENHCDISMLAHEEALQDNMIEWLQQLRFLLKKIGINKFRLLVYHLIIGNQIVVRCDYPQTAELIVRSLEMLLPKGCCNTLHYSNDRVESFRANLLAIPLRSSQTKRRSIVGPSEDLYFFLDVYVKGSFRRRNFKPLNYSAKVRANVHSPIQVPKVVLRYVDLIDSAQIPTKAALSQLQLIKQEWMIKSKIYFAYGRFECYANFSNNELYRCLDVDDVDLPVLRFWQKGISMQHRRLILKLQAERIYEQHRLKAQSSSVLNCDQYQSNGDLMSIDGSVSHESKIWKHTPSNNRSAAKSNEQLDPMDESISSDEDMSRDSDARTHSLWELTHWSLLIDSNNRVASDPVPAQSLTRRSLSSATVDDDEETGWMDDQSISIWDWDNDPSDECNILEESDIGESGGEADLSTEKPISKPSIINDNECTSLYDAALKFNSSFMFKLPFVTNSSLSKHSLPISLDRTASINSSSLSERGKSAAL